MLSEVPEKLPALYVTGQFVHNSTLLVPTSNLTNAVQDLPPYFKIHLNNILY
jgi:hypothetical protein